MVQVDLSFTLSVLVPIMFVLVFEVASKARTLDLYELLPNDEPQPRTGWEESLGTFFTGILPKLEYNRHIPRFGHFGSLYAVSRVILTYGAGLIGYGLDGDSRFVLGLAIMIMMGVLPLIEVDEYRYIDTRSGFPNSARLHLIGYIIPLTIASFLGHAWSRGISPLMIIILGFLLVFIPSVIVTIYFSTILERELRENRPN